MRVNSRLAATPSNLSPLSLLKPSVVPTQSAPSMSSKTTCAESPASPSREVKFENEPSLKRLSPEDVANQIAPSRDSYA
jgi:hypothetical protein